MNTKNTIKPGFSVDIVQEIKNATMLGDKLIFEQDFAADTFTVTAVHDDGTVTSVTERSLDYAVRGLNQAVYNGTCKAEMNDPVEEITGASTEELEKAEEEGKEVLKTEEEKQAELKRQHEEAKKARAEAVKRMDTALEDAISKPGLADKLFTDEFGKEYGVTKDEFEKSLADRDEWSDWFNGVATLDYHTYNGSVVATYDTDLGVVSVDLQ